MKNKIKVYARSFNRKTGKSVSNLRVEEIDLKKNKIFKSCNSLLDIKYRYESFWNELNNNSIEVVFVQEIVA